MIMVFLIMMMILMLMMKLLMMLLMMMYPKQNIDPVFASDSHLITR